MHSEAQERCTTAPVATIFDIRRKDSLATHVAVTLDCHALSLRNNEGIVAQRGAGESGATAPVDTVRDIRHEDSLARTFAVTLVCGAPNLRTGEGVVAHRV